MKDYPNLITMWETIDCIAERCIVCRARWLTCFADGSGELAGVRTRLKTTEDGMMSWPNKLCNDCSRRVFSAELTRSIGSLLIMQERGNTYG